MAKVRANRSNYYVGETQNQLRDGYGVYYYKNKFFRYEGDWVKGKKHGHGKLVMADGSYYEGEFKDGEIQGHGFRKWEHSGNSYSGEFYMGEMHGYGVLNYADGGQYKGEFAKNSRHGNGVFRDKHGNEYEGAWHNNKQNGHGILTFWNGDIYEGDFVKGHRQGHGILQCADGGVYEGQWYADVYSGEGRLTHCSGVTYDGLWLNGQPAMMPKNIAFAETTQPIVCIQGQGFNLQLQLFNQNGEVVTEESGRKFEVTAGYRHPGPSKSHQSLLELIEDIEEKPISTPFGYDILPYPIVDANSENISDSTNSMGSKPTGSLQSSFELKPNESTESIFKDESSPAKQPSLTDSTISIDDYKAYFQPSISPKVVTDGQLQFENIFLPFVPMNPKAPDDTKAKRSKGSRTGSAVSSSSSDSKQNMAKSKVPTEKGAKPGEYVLIIKDVTEPPFLNHKVEPFFTLVNVVQSKQQTKKSRVK